MTLRLTRGKQCRCENKNQPPDTGKACEGQTQPDPFPAPKPKTNDKVGDAIDLDSSEDASVPTEQTTDQESPNIFEGLGQSFQTASVTTQPSEFDMLYISPAISPPTTQESDGQQLWGDTSAIASLYDNTSPTSTPAGKDVAFASYDADEGYNTETS